LTRHETLKGRVSETVEVRHFGYSRMHRIANATRERPSQHEVVRRLNEP